jgi:hypothetical protein
MNRHTTISTAAAAFAALAVAAPGASAYIVASPDARDANLSAQRAQGPVIVQAPDARDANLAAQRGHSIGSVPRSPDAADLNRFAREPQSRPVVVQVPGETTQARAVSSFDWGDAGIAAGVTLALMALAGAAVVVTRRHTHHFPHAH